VPVVKVAFRNETLQGDAVEGVDPAASLSVIVKALDATEVAREQFTTAFSSKASL
jgi:hypothetical protein